MLVKAQLAEKQGLDDEAQLGAEFDEDVFDSEMEDLDYEHISEEEADEGNQKIFLSQKDMEKHLEEYYEARRQAKEEKQQQIRDAKQERKDRR